MPFPKDSTQSPSGTVTDPHGYNWTIATRKEDLSKQEMEQRQAEWIVYLLENIDRSGFRRSALRYGGHVVGGLDF